MEPSYWASEHSDALREFIALGLSWSEAAAAINRKFETSYTRNAVLGRARRMGLMAPTPPELSPGSTSTLNRLGGIRPAEPRIPGFIGRCRCSNGPKRTNCAASRSSRAIFPWSIWSARIAVTRMAEMKRAKP